MIFKYLLLLNFLLVSLCSLMAIGEASVVASDPAAGTSLAAAVQWEGCRMRTGSLRHGHQNKKR